mmetsp:Transcript_65391/g.151719  ORF Transcript_65391/g.151719 Transcript_65391/m.151719 type:complete len:789 (-) Transcript_65391:201-2567(-)
MEGGRKSTGEDVKRENRSLTSCEYLRVFLAIAVPSAILIITLSDVPGCFGVVIFDAVSQKSFNLTGDAVVACSIMILALYYVRGITAWDHRYQALALVLPWAGFMLGALFKARRYPTALMLMIMLHEVVFLFTVRRRSCLNVYRENFYTTVAVITALVAALAMAAMVAFVYEGEYWLPDRTELTFAEKLKRVYDNVGMYNLGKPLNYTTHCGIGGNPTELSKYKDKGETLAKYEAACTIAHRVLVWVFACPLVAFFANVAVCVFATSQASMLVVNMTSKEIILKQFLAVTSVVVAGIYVSVWFSGLAEDVMSALGVCCFLGLAVVMAWAYWELDITELVKNCAPSKLMEIMKGFVESDWVKAMAVGSGFVPLFLALEKCRQWCRKKEELPAMAALYVHMVEWNWTNILLNVCILGEVFFTLQVGFSKLTSIFLSWMNVQLEGMDFLQLNLVMFGVGFLMFLCPAVPGNAVYLFVGLVDGVQASKSIGFLKGCAAAICVCSFTKLVACTGQYGIGYWMSRSTKIRQMVGVTSVQIRAMEELLKAPGMGLGKVAVLVCGPDWPVSVLCGIFRLNIPRMLLGTLPVLLVSIIPTALAGACQGVAKPGDDLLQSVATSCILLCGLLTAAGTLIMMNSVTAVISEKGEELAQPREADAAVEKLNAQQEKYLEVHRNNTSWNKLLSCEKFALLSAAVLMLLHGFIVVGAGSMCFQKFEVSGKLENDFDNYGLGCKEQTLTCGLTNIIVRPGGLIVLALFAVAVLLHVLFVLATNRRVQEAYMRDRESSTALVLK